MANRLVAVSIILVCMAGPAAGQKTHPSKAPTPGGGPKYLSEPFDINAASVGPEFNGHDIVAITKMVKEAPALKPKSEFESSGEYERRKASFRSQPLVGNITPDSHLAFVVGSEFKYDADGQVLTATVTSWQKEFFPETGYSLTEAAPKMDTVTVRSTTRERGTYIGSNAFGAKVEVTETYSEDYGLASEPASWVFNDYDEVSRPRFSRSSAMSPDEARRFKPNARVLFICKLTEPWYRQSASGHDPTIDEPYKTLHGLNFLQVHVEQIWLIDGDSGEVVRKFSEDSSANERAGPHDGVLQQLREQKTLLAVSGRQTLSLLDELLSLYRTNPRDPRITSAKEQLRPLALDVSGHLTRFTQILNSNRALLRAQDLGEFDDVLRLSNAVNEKVAQLKAMGFAF